MWRNIDQSPYLSQLLEDISTYLAKNQGVVPLLGIFFFIIGFILLLINVFASLHVIEFFGLFFQGVGIITALIGLLLVEALGG